MSSRMAVAATRSLRGPAARVRVLPPGSIDVLPPSVAPLAARTTVMAALQHTRLFSAAAATAAKDFAPRGSVPQSQRNALLMVPLTAQPWAMVLGNRRLLSSDRMAEDAIKAASAAEKTEEAAKENTSKGRSESSSRSKDDKNFSFISYFYLLSVMLQKFIQWLRCTRIKEEFRAAGALGLALVYLTERCLWDLDERMMVDVNERLTKSLSIEGTDLTKSTESTDPQFAQKKAEIDAQHADQQKENEEFRHTAIIVHLQCVKDTLSNNNNLEQEIHELMLNIHKYYQNITERSVECNIKMEEKLQGMLQARAANISSLDDQLCALKKSRLS